MTTNIYSLGSNGSGQLGAGHEEDLSSPALIAIPAEAGISTIKSIRAGGNHTLLLDTNGQVYATGYGEDGRCASSMSQHTFSRLPYAPKSRLCAATWEATICVADETECVWVCGTGLKGELGLGTTKTNAAQLTAIPDFPSPDTHVLDIAAGMGHVVVVLSNGDVYGWGNGQQGQLGGPIGIVWQPRKLPQIPFRAVRAVCGKDFTVIFGAAELGQLAILGVRKRDRFGIQANIPNDIRGWRDVQATWGGIYILKHDGKIVAWGRDDHGQLPPQGLPSIKAIAAGSEHFLAVTDQNKVLAWGWGEHGNCSVPVDERKDVKGRWNELVFTGYPVHIAGGCATSWIVTEQQKQA